MLLLPNTYCHLVKIRGSLPQSDLAATTKTDIFSEALAKSLIGDELRIDVFPCPPDRSTSPYRHISSGTLRDALQGDLWFPSQHSNRRRVTALERQVRWGDGTEPLTRMSMHRQESLSSPFVQRIITRGTRIRNIRETHPGYARARIWAARGYAPLLPLEATDRRWLRLRVDPHLRLRATDSYTGLQDAGRPFRNCRDCNIAFVQQNAHPRARATACVAVVLSS
ncbi:hypothetical protein FIBSPDRAFT_101898 [Athelia psychrophila]|uniref:Uncharacterized protein n=1 Tax=Athelia psychrophila TaxID=1759441 RepID=A0A166DH43_9AGAM|nr:hypothetical protein FIBSPDRAFT_101898 [Fibularhizoctonia sp. CBS 109695]